MAYSSRGTGGRSSSRGGGRSSYAPPRGGGGGNNAMPMVIAGVAVVAVIVIAVLVMGGKKTPPQAPPEIGMSPAPAPATPGKKEPELGPRPNLPPGIVTRAKALMPKIKAAGEQGKKLGDEALAAKNAGDPDKWQALLEEAREVFKTARDEWNSIEDEVIEFLSKNPSKGWDENMLIDAYLKTESRDVQRMIDEPLSGLAKTSRGH